MKISEEDVMTFKLMKKPHMNEDDAFPIALIGTWKLKQNIFHQMTSCLSKCIDI